MVRRSPHVGFPRLVLLQGSHDSWNDKLANNSCSERTQGISLFQDYERRSGVWTVNVGLFPV